MDTRNSGKGGTHQDIQCVQSFIWYSGMGWTVGTAVRVGRTGIFPVCPPYGLGISSPIGCLLAMLEDL